MKGEKMTATDFVLDFTDVQPKACRPVEPFLPSRSDDGDRMPPVLAAERLSDGSGRVKVYCRYCRRFHLHGEPTDEGTRRREAHCTAETPYKRSGYILHVVEPGTYDAETLRRVASRVADARNLRS
jgi:hypothetical protein